MTADALIDLIVEQQIVEAPEPIMPSTDLFSLGLDSMAMMQLLLHIEDRFGIAITPGEMTRERFATAEALAAFLTEKASAR